MNTSSRSYFKRFYRLVAVAAAVMTAVMTGSLVLGDSVRGSLTERVDERLGNAETLILTGTGFLNDTILSDPLLAHAKGCLLVEGFVSLDGQMIPVTVWGMDGDSPGQGETLINEELANRLGRRSERPGFARPLVVHLPTNGLVASNALFVSQRYATQLRLAMKGVKPATDGGNLLLHNEQVRPLNVFMNRQELADALGLKDKVNVICSPDRISDDEFGRIWKQEYAGIQIHDGTVGTDRVFLSQAAVDALKPRTRYLAYFVNSLGNIPYSFVTATDQLHGDETILTDYTARRMNAHVGDSVTMEYYVAQGGLKQLATRSHRFCVSRIVPVSDFQQQAELITADFPGLAGIRRCTDWDSDLPIDMSRITEADENYWSEYRQLPKALVSLDAVGPDWTGSYGVATKLRVDVNENEKVGLSHRLLGVTVVQPRESALRAAQNGTDFGMLFLALGFFIIVASMLLMQNPLLEMYLVRQAEIRLFSVLGFSKCQVFLRLLSEALPVVLLASPVGVLLGYAYAAAILWLLSGPWSGATHTDGFALHARLSTVVISLMVTVALALAVVSLAICSAQKERKARKQKTPKAFRQAKPGRFILPASLFYYRRQHRLSFWTLALGVLVVFAVGLNRPDFSHSAASATGGYQFYAESHIPIQYDLNNAESRRHLHVDDLPTDTRFLQLPKHTEDEASCLNLNKVEAPSVLGMTADDMKAFGIDTTHLSTASGQPTVVPVAIDEESLRWSLMKQVGDTLNYHAAGGREIKAVIATAYPTGILHGHAIMPLEQFRQLWPDEAGSRIILGNSDGIATPLADYGVSIVPTTDRLRMFFEVTDTYLHIFLSLGGLGLLLGLASLLTVIRKNLLARREEIRLYQTLGFTTETIVGIWRREQMIAPLLAVVAGVLGSFGVSLLIPVTSCSFSLTAIVLLMLILLFTWFIIHISINSKTIKQCEMYS